MEGLNFCSGAPRGNHILDGAPGDHNGDDDNDDDCNDNDDGNDDDDDDDDETHSVATGLCWPCHVVLKYLVLWSMSLYIVTPFDNSCYVLAYKDSLQLLVVKVGDRLNRLLEPFLNKRWGL